MQIFLLWRSAVISSDQQRTPSFSNRLLPPYIGLSDEESQTCREVFQTHFQDIP